MEGGQERKAPGRLPARLQKSGSKSPEPPHGKGTSLERTTDAQEAAPREAADTESVGRQTGEAFRLWFALVCEKFVHLDSWQTF